MPIASTTLPPSAAPMEPCSPPLNPFAAAASPRPAFASALVGAPPAPALAQGKRAFALALCPDYVAKTLAGTAVYTEHSNNEFVQISDPNNSLRSLGILCSRQEDVQLLHPLFILGSATTAHFGKGARVVAMTLDQVYMLKVEGIGFRCLPDPLQIKNALALKSANVSRSFDGVPVFHEDIETELLKVSKASRGSEFSHNIMVVSLEDVLKKVEMNDKNSG